MSRLTPFFVFENDPVTDESRRIGDPDFERTDRGVDVDLLDFRARFGVVDFMDRIVDRYMDRRSFAVRKDQPGDRRAVDVLAEHDAFHLHRSAFVGDAQAARYEKFISVLFGSLPGVFYVQRRPAVERVAHRSPELGDRRRKRHESYAPAAVQILQLFPDVGRDDISFDERIAQHRDPYRRLPSFFNRAS